MLELVKRLALAPWSGVLLVLASILANALALAVPLFVIQVLNRFLAVGEMSTLYALAAGAVIAILFEALLRTSRYRLARAQSAVQDMNLYTGVGTVLSEAAPRELRARRQNARLDWIEALARLQQGHGPQHLCALLDVPFSIVFVIIIYLINPTLGMVAGGAAIVLMLSIIVIIKRDQHKQRMLSGEAQSIAGRLRAVAVGGDRSRLFASSDVLRRQWRELANDQIELARLQARRISAQLTASVLIQAALTIAVISLGAVLTLRGELDVGSLIGVNILAARALMPISRFAASYEAAESASTARSTISNLRKLPVVSKERSALIGQIQSLSLRNVTLRPGPGAVPYFHKVEGVLTPGILTAVFSEDDNAAAAFLDMLAGVEMPDEGMLLVNDVNMEQVPFEWWRQQIGLAPARPQFQPGSLIENFRALKDGSEEDVLKALQDAGVRKAVESHPDGLNMTLTVTMDAFPAEIRWRLGLARALYMNAPVLLVEDPVSVVGRDLAGRLYELARRWVAEGRVVVIATADQDHARKSDQIVELRRGRPALAHTVRAVEDTVAGAAFAAGRMPGDKAGKDATDRDLSGVRRAAQAVTIGMVALVGAGAYWAYTAKIDRVTQAQGEVVPSAQVQTIESLEGGIVSRILVTEGAMVERGQPIMELASIADDADIGELSVRLASLQLTSARLRAELEGVEEFVPPEVQLKNNPDLARQAVSLFKSRRDRLQLDLATQRQVVRQREQAIVEFDTAIETSRRQIGIVREQVSISEGLLRDELTNRMLHLDIVSNLAQLEAQLAKAQAGRRTAVAALDEAKSQLDLIFSTFEEEAYRDLEAVTAQLREFANRMGKLQDTRQRRVLRSPMTGAVKALSTFSEGAVVGPGEVVAEVVPEDDAFVIEALLPVSEIGFVKRGMNVRIRLATRDAFRFNAIDGTVLRVSPDTFTNEQDQTFYKMTVSTTATAFPGDQQSYDLVPGLQVNCAVLLGQRTIFEYLVQPIMRSFGTAFRER